MSDIRPELSTKNRYYIGKHRFHELKHFCRQYSIWVEMYKNFDELTSNPERKDDLNRFIKAQGSYNDYVAKMVIQKRYLEDRINMIEDTVRSVAPDIYEYLLIGVTEGKGYPYLRDVRGLPASKDYYYDRYRKFFYILSQKRQ